MNGRSTREMRTGGIRAGGSRTRDNVSAQGDEKVNFVGRAFSGSKNLVQQRANLEKLLKRLLPSVPSVLTSSSTCS
jgi:hypothetical protein